MPNCFATEIIKTTSLNQARVTRVTTPHGAFLTPTFMPVGTRAFINQMTPQDLLKTGSQMILGGNTYHMLVSPGTEVIQAVGGMHRFMGWNGPMLTDSGGFQVFSLARQGGRFCRIDAKGAHFKHPQNGQLIHLTAQKAIETQRIIGADIIMAFDQCTPEGGGREAALIAMERTHQWLMQSKEQYERSPYSIYAQRQALFGIIQGGSFRDLREQSAQFVVAADLDGIAIGGEAIGFDMHKTLTIIDWVRPLLPPEKTRYTMGVGLHPQDLIDVVARGIDIFDCVSPTRNARHGALYHGELLVEGGWLRFSSAEKSARILIKKAIYAKDNGPLLAGCHCYTCRHYSRAYLHFLFKQGASLYYPLACIHNIHLMQATCAKMRALLLQEAEASAQPNEASSR